MYVICPICWGGECSNPLHHKIEIDDDIAKGIVLLNQKGYKTNFCCSGHLDRSIFDFYVSFKERQSFSNLPDNFKMNRANTRMNYKKTRDVSKVEAEKAWRDFYNWVLQL